MSAFGPQGIIRQVCVCVLVYILLHILQPWSYPSWRGSSRAGAGRIRQLNRDLELFPRAPELLQCDAVQLGHANTSRVSLPDSLPLALSERGW